VGMNIRLTIVVAALATLLPAAHAAPRTVTRAQLQKVLIETELTVEYQQAPAREVIVHLQQMLGIQIVGRYSDDRVGHGIDPETPITLGVTETPALTVLELVLAQCEDLDPCTWQLRNGYVEVGTKERLSAPAAQEIRIYSIRDLMMAVPHFGNAPDLDISAALSQAAAGGGGGAGGGGFGGGGGGGGSGGGAIIGPPGEDPRRTDDLEFVDQLVNLIQQTVEPDAWIDDRASISYLSGNLVVRAADFIHRRLGGSP
jgi:uncharacterized membrane protein YgcG